MPQNEERRRICRRIKEERKKERQKKNEPHDKESKKEGKKKRKPGERKNKGRRIMLKITKEGNRKEKCLEKEIIHLLKSLILYYFRSLYFSMFNVEKIFPFSLKYK